MRQNRTRALATIVLTGLAALLAHPAAAQIKTGDPFPDFASFQLQGKMPAIQGKVVLVDFWASWCGPCKKSFPVMNGLQKKYGDRIVIVAVNVDETQAGMQSFLEKVPVEFAVLWDAKQSLVNKVDVHTMPSSFLLDRSGKVRFAHSGFHGAETQDRKSVV